MKHIERHVSSPAVQFFSLAALVAAVLALSACSGGGGSSGLAGAATIRGTVIEFTAADVAWLPEEPKSAPAKLAAMVADLFVPSAHAAVPGVVVRVAGTDLITTTGADGFFIIGGVPPGLDVQLIFSRGDDAAVFTLDVPRESEIDLRDIRVVDETVEVEEIAVVVSEDNIDGDGSSVDLDGDGRADNVTVTPSDGGTRNDDDDVVDVEPRPGDGDTGPVDDRDDDIPGIPGGDDDPDDPPNTVLVGNEKPVVDDNTPDDGVVAPVKPENSSGNDSLAVR